MGFFSNKQYEDYLVSKGYEIDLDHPEYDWECEHCGKGFRTKSATKKHEKTCKNKTRKTHK